MFRAELKHRLAAVEVVAGYDPGVIKLIKYIEYYCSLIPRIKLKLLRNFTELIFTQTLKLVVVF